MDATCLFCFVLFCFSALFPPPAKFSAKGGGKAGEEEGGLVGKLRDCKVDLWEIGLGTIAACCKLGIRARIGRRGIKVKVSRSHRDNFRSQFFQAPEAHCSLVWKSPLHFFRPKKKVQSGKDSSILVLLLRCIDPPPSSFSLGSAAFYRTNSPEGPT